MAATQPAASPHRHRFTTDDGRTIRVCSICDETQLKISGRWVRKDATQPHEWKTQHAAHCAVTSERADLLSMLERDPTNYGLLGAVPEYDNGGDQEAENCDCGAYDRAQALLVNALTTLVPLPVPYEGTQPLVIDPAAKDAHYHNEMHWLFAHLAEDEAPRVFAAAVALYQAGAGTFAECLRTAVIWERG